MTTTMDTSFEAELLRMVDSFLSSTPNHDDLRRFRGELHSHLWDRVAEVTEPIDAPWLKAGLSEYLNRPREVQEKSNRAFDALIPHERARFFVSLCERADWTTKPPITPRDRRDGFGSLGDFLRLAARERRSYQRRFHPIDTISEAIHYRAQAPIDPAEDGRQPVVERPTGGVTVYRTAIEGGYGWVLPHRSDIQRGPLRLDGSSLAHRWSRMRVRVAHRELSGRPLKHADLPSHDGSPLTLTRRAREILEPVLRDHGEFLELDADEPLWVFNVTRHVGALDRTHSRMELVPVSTRAELSDLTREVWWLAFSEFAASEHPVFRSPMERGSRLFLGDEVVQLVETHKLHGTFFKPVWNSIHGSYRIDTSED